MALLSASAPARRAAAAGLLLLLLLPDLVSATKLSRTPFADRRLVQNGFSPDYTSSSCRNDDPTKPSTLTAVQCCDSHFNWNPSCPSSTANWLMAQLYGEDYQDERAKRWYPDPDGKGCLEDGPSRPSWVASLADDYGTCCERYKQWAQDECLAADPARLADRIALHGEDIVMYWPDTTVGYCRPDSSDSPVARPNWEQRLEARLDECCFRYFKWNMETCTETMHGSPIETPTASPSKSPSITIEDLDCSMLSRKQCLLFAPRCVFVRNFEDNSMSYCTAPYDDYTLDNFGSEERCQVAGKAECYTIQNCIWHDDAGTCVFLSPPPPSPPAEDAQGGTGGGSTGGSTCGDATFKAACTNISGCRWKKKVKRCIPTDGGSTVDAACSRYPKEGCMLIPACQWENESLICTGANVPDTAGDEMKPHVGGSSGGGLTSTVTTTTSTPPPQDNVDCLAVDSLQCKSLVGVCVWRKKKGCEFVPQPTLSPTRLPTPKPTSSPTRLPTPSPTRTKFYYSPEDGLCRIDSPEGSARPSWIGLDSVFDDVETCCGLSFDRSLCLANAPTLPLDGTAEGDEESDELWDGTYYYDSSDALCHINGPDRPSWISTVYEDFRQCCTVSWDTNKCVSNEPDPPDKSDWPSPPTEWPSPFPTVFVEGDEDPATVAIEIRVGGKVKLRFDGNGVHDLPDLGSSGWTMLEVALTKTVVFTFAECNLVHPDIDVRLVSIGGHPFNGRQRRNLRGARRKLAVQNFEFEVTLVAKCDDRCREAPGSTLGYLSPFHGIKSYFDRKVNDGTFATILMTEGAALGLFQVTGPPSATNGELTYVRAVESRRAGLTFHPTFRPTGWPTESTPPPTEDIYYPDSKRNVCRTVTEGSGVIRFGSIEKCCAYPWMSGGWAQCVDGSFEIRDATPEMTRNPTRPPTRLPTRRPVTVDEPHETPTGGVGGEDIDSEDSADEGMVFYPDSKQNVCRTVTDGSGIVRFGSIEKCCAYPWMAGSLAQCVDDSIELKDTTPKLTRNPTRPPTRRPMEVDEPDDETPTGGVQGGGSSTVMSGMVFYPDFDQGVCRWDGKHQNSPYRFSNAEECCSNRLMDYGRCMSHADPYGNGRDETKVVGGMVFYPDFVLGLCRWDGKHQNSPYRFSTAKECCSNQLMDYGRCMSHADPYGSGGGNDSADEDDDKPSIQTASCRWHPDPLNFGSCVYSPHYPPHWADKSTSTTFLYDTHGECCLGTYSQGGCGEELACGGDATGSSGGGGAGGGNPTFNPTGDTKPTRRPTTRPLSRGEDDGSEDDTPVPSPAAPANLPTRQTDNLGYIKLIDATSLQGVVTDGFESGKLDGRFPWSTTESYPWTVSSDGARSGAYSAASPVDLPPGSKSELHLGINAPQGGALFYDVKPDVMMPRSGFYINLDGTSKKGYTFPKDWAQGSISIPPGEHGVTFQVTAPDVEGPVESSSSGVVRIDDVSFYPTILEDFEGGRIRTKNAEFAGVPWSLDATSGGADGSSTCLKSPALFGSNSSSKFKITVEVPPMGGDLAFEYWSTVWMPEDKFMVKINHTVVTTVSSSTLGWESVTRGLPPGTSTVEFEYATMIGGEGSVWLDNIRVTPRW
ncbi:hypothetical protein THAOC_10314 [Thalassiosira oceanica]|uniref:Uncharacterized protein n=1 Tax=Thalassiosira oceanica TaxID=159749 RepID=K0TDA2_THAOC|nr:hypothetical protein THAOC_10314 [Thalassiosira oceanica]|eukprot:EJK68497.1 hypothetical protein THAOC_10314 [Thalassiosira oceanica]